MHETNDHEFYRHCILDAAAFGLGIAIAIVCGLAVIAMAYVVSVTL